MMEDMREPGETVCDFRFDRVAVHPEQVAKYRLLTGKRKPGDKDKHWFPGIDGDPERTCQAEALPPDVLVKLVQRAVRAEVDIDQYHRDVALEAKERRSIQRTLKEKLSAHAR
jgi:hypothetical protein